MKISRKRKNVRKAFAFRKPRPNCGGQGPHFAPPSLGEPGFWTCEKPASKALQFVKASAMLSAP